MADWASGYVTEVGYTQGYYRELSPLAIRFALHCAGYEAPPAENFSYCELGFGQGVSLNFHAAAHPECQFVGADINPSHVAGAKILARASQARLELLDRSFAELAAWDDLPSFDYIGVHGVWSWISAENQATMVDFVRKRLRPGGVLYISYNCLPGWSQAMPLRHLLCEHAQRAASANGGVIGRMEDALAFTQKLAGTGLGYFAGAGVKDKLDSMSRQNRNYLAHEYMNRDWRVMHFAEVAESLAAARLDFATSASPVDQLDSFRIPRQGLELLATLNDPIQRQTVRDYLVNQQFRRDLFVRGPLKLTPAEQQRQLGATGFVLLRPAATLLKEAGESGKRGIPADVYETLVKTLDQHGVLSMKQLAEACPATNVALLRQVLMLLVSQSEIAVALPEAGRAAASAACRRLNAAVVARAGEGNEVPYLCSPVTAGGIPMGAFQQLMVRVLGEAGSDPVDAEQLANAAWKYLSAVGQRVVSGGKTCETEADNLATLQRIARDFLERDRSLLINLGIVS